MSTRRRRIALKFAVVALLAEILVLRQRGYGAGGNVIVRCREGHLYRTLWIPGLSVKSLRLGWWRFQRCPVGDHWSFVTPVPEAEIPVAELDAARATTDIRLP